MKETSKLFKKHLQKVSEAWNIKTLRPFIEFALEKISEHWNDKNVFIVEAPTGYGKSTISATLALYSIAEELKAIVCYPLRTLIEDQYDAFTGRKKSRKAICDENLIGVRYMHHPNSRYLIKPITLTTVDTFALTLFGIAPEDFEKALKAYEGISFSFGHYMFSWASALLSNVVLDEVHLLADSTKSLNFLIALLKIAMRFDQKLILMTATLPKALKKIVVDSLREYSDKIVFITFSKNSDFGYSYFDEGFVKERMSKEYEVEIYALREDEKYYKLVELIKNCKGFRRAIAVFNTVEDAVNFYLTVKGDKEICRVFDKILVIHSRFTESDRKKKNEELRNLGDSYLVIATQVIEAGIDISSDFFITEIAPANSLIQRLGRFLRYEEKKGKIIVWYETEGEELKRSMAFDIKRGKTTKWICINTESDEIFEECVGILKKDFENANFKKLSEWRGNRDIPTVITPRFVYKVYDYELTLKTLEWIRKHKLNVHVPEGANVKGYRDLLDYVYSEKDFCIDAKTIDELLKIHDHLEDPSKAVEVLIELEGSFIRDEYLVNVLSAECIDKFVGRNEREICRLVSEFCIPLSARMLRSLKVIGFLYVDEEGKITFEELKTSPNPKDLLRGIWIDREKKYVFPIAFVARIVYDGEIGLRVKE